LLAFCFARLLICSSGALNCYAAIVNRRKFLGTALAVPLRAKARAPRIVLRSSWQTVNIGDIGHTPGVLALLEKYIPEAELFLWPSHVTDGVEPMLRKRFPRLTISKDPQVHYGCDFLLHGSGPFLAGHKQVAEWKRDTKKPYGVYGITMAPASDPEMRSMSNNGLDAGTKDLLDDARFVYLRDSVSMGVVKAAGVRSPVIGFGPDGAFAADVSNDAAAEAFLRTHQLQPGRFLCCIPRLRETPYWKVKPNVPFDPKKQARNDEMKEHDHAPLRAAITAVVKQTGMKVLLCPEDSTQMETAKEMLYDPLPADVRSAVVWRKDYWLTDEAVSTYRRSAGIFGNEMHSPIMCVGHGIPAIVCRFREQTSKGFMWRDIGLGDWLFDLDKDEDLPRVAAAVVAMAKNPPAARARAAKARAFVQQRQRSTMAVLRKELQAIGLL
jgi:polysaccharide pyruvyl transferase WcaK-like protein